MRTLQDSELQHESHPFGRHFLNVSSAYQEDGKATAAYKNTIDELLCGIEELEKALTFGQGQTS